MPLINNHWGCTAILQISIIALGFTAIVMAGYCLQYDRDWNVQLAKDRHVFSETERTILTRKNYVWESLFISAVTLTTSAGCIHLVLCFLIKRELYIEKFHKIILSLMAIVYFGSSAFEIISAILYDAKYTEMENIDTRQYTIRFQINDTDVRQKSPSPFFYCHMGYGKPRKASELKGLRIKQIGANLCQLIGLKIISGVLSMYSGLLCFVTIWQAASHERFVNAKAAKQLFELYGDSEEYDYEHVRSPSVTEGLGIVDHDAAGAIIVPASAKHIRRKGINIKDTMAYKGIDAFRG